MPNAEPYREYFKTGTVISTNPATLTCDILKTTGGELHNVPVINTTGGIQSNDGSWTSNLRGAVVFYTYICGKPYIMGTLPMPVKLQNQVSLDSTQTKTGGANAHTYGKSDSGFSGGRNTGYLPGDKVFSADGGAELALLNGGAALLKASPMAQIILGAMKDFIKIVCREFHLMTDFGELKFCHGSSGRTGLSITGGAAYGEEAQAGAGTNTVHMYLGDTPDAPESRFGVRVNSPDGGEFGAFMIGKDGKLVCATSRDALHSVGEDNHIRVNGSEYHQIDQSQSVEISSDQAQTVMGERHTVVGKKETHSVGENLELQVAGTLRIGAGAIVLTSASGTTGPCDLTCKSFNIVKG